MFVLADMLILFTFWMSILGFTLEKKSELGNHNQKQTSSFISGHLYKIGLNQRQRQRQRFLYFTIRLRCSFGFEFRMEALVVG